MPAWLLTNGALLDRSLSETFRIFLPQPPLQHIAYKVDPGAFHSLVLLL